MPIYEFKCKACGQTDSIRLKFQEYDNVQRCARCQRPMVRLISRPQIITNPYHLRPEFRLDAGKSADEIRAEREADDAAWARNWGDKSLPTPPRAQAEGPTLLDIPMEDKPADAATLNWLAGGE